MQESNPFWPLEEARRLRPLGESAEAQESKIFQRLKSESTASSGFSSEQQDNQKVETSKKTYNLLDKNPIFQGKKGFSSVLHNKANIYGSITSGTKPYSASAGCTITRGGNNLNHNNADTRMTSGAKSYSALERCAITHDGSKLETKMERKHEFSIRFK